MALKIGEPNGDTNILPRITALLLYNKPNPPNNPPATFPTGFSTPSASSPTPAPNIADTISSLTPSYLLFFLYCLYFLE